MPLELNEPTFDRTFEEIYRELRSRIPRYTPEWTNFNDSDPGITLLQLFAWLAEMTLYRMNQMPRKNYLKFAQLLGLQLAPARPATVRLVFAPKPSERPSTIKSGSRYSAQVEGAPPVIFETAQASTSSPRRSRRCSSSPTGRRRRSSFRHCPPVEIFYPFGRNPEPEDTLYLGFKPNPNNTAPFPEKMRFLALRPAGGHERAAPARGRSEPATSCLRWTWCGSSGRSGTRTCGSGSTCSATTPSRSRVTATSTSRGRAISSRP